MAHLSTRSLYYLPPRKPGVLSFIALLVCLGAATIAAALLTENPIVAAAPVLAVAALYALWHLELRTTMVLLMALCLLFEGPIDEPGLLRPLYYAGGLLMLNLNVVTHIGPLAFCGVDAIVGFLLLVIVFRKATGKPMSGTHQVETARVLWTATMITFLGTLFMLGLGLARGGDFKALLWQGRVLIYLSGMLLLFQTALRGPGDYPLLARVIVIAACFRAVLCAVLVRIKYSAAEDYNAATSHSDSIIFALACTILIADVFEDFRKRHLLRAALVLPIIFAGMVLNHRRIVWVQLSSSLLAVFLLSGSRLKRRLTRGMIVGVPVIALYFAIGTRSGSKFFAPVHALTSVSTRPDASTEFRDVENKNLIFTLGGNLLFGAGFGHPYLEVIQNWDISFFKLYRYMPHNAVLGLWAFNGLVGFVLIWFMLPVGVFLCARSYPRARSPDERAAALVGIAAVLVYGIQCFGDIGTTSWMGVFTVGPLLACAGKLAVACGAWPSAARKLQAIPRPLPAPIRRLPASAGPSNTGSSS